MRLLNYNYVWGKRCVFNNFLKISNELADLIDVGSLVHTLAAVTVKVRSPALVRVLGQQIRNRSVLDPRSQSISQTLKKLHWLPIEKRIIFKLLLLTYKAQHGLASSYLTDILTPYQPARHLRSSNQALLCVPKTSTSYYGRSFAVAGPTLWNNLPQSLRQTHSLIKFKSSLKTYLFVLSRLVNYHCDLFIYKKAVIIILLDLSAAFDTIDHEVLLQRLHVDFKVDATALAWFRSYLHCRRQMVNINGTLSEEALLKYGVPQGSVLGPLLFTLYIAPLGEIARHHGLQVHFYADDTQLYVTFDPGVRDEDADAISRLTTCLAEIRQWMVLNFVKLNDDKTEYLVISSPHMQNKIVPQNLQVGCVSVPPSENARNLGVFFDQCMKMDKHISKVCQATYYQLRNISAIRSLLTRSAAESLIHSLVTSRIDFCNSLLVGLPSAMLNRLQGVQNAAARLLTGTKKYDHITPILTELHWLPIKYRIEFKILLLTFKAVHGLAPGYVTSLIEQRRLRPGLRSSGTGITLHVPITHLRGYGDRAFSSIAPRLWNSLPSSLREIDSIDLFKSSLKTHLFQQMCNN